jgi:hypothetical protein
MNLLENLLFSLITGIISSIIVVIYFEYQQNKKHKLSHAHILHKFISQMFGILTVIRVSADLPYPRGNNQNEILVKLEEILGRKNPSVLMGRIPNLGGDKHKYIYEQLLMARQSLSMLFSDSIAHKTIDGKISASIAEAQVWVEAVLSNYQLFPEILNNQADTLMITSWTTSIFNLTENTFGILTNTLARKEVPDEMLRWGTRG